MKVMSMVIVTVVYVTSALSALGIREEKAHDVSQAPGLQSTELTAQSGNATVPSYMETDLTGNALLVFPGRSMMPLKTTDDGLLVLVDSTLEGIGMRVKLLDSTGTRVRDFPIDLDAPGQAVALYVDPNGNICVLVDEWIRGKEAYKRQVIVFSPHGGKVRTTILGEVPFSNVPWVWDFAIDAKGTIYAGTVGKGIEVFDAQGTPGQPLATYHVAGLDIDSDGKLYVAGHSSTENKSFLSKIDPATGKQVWRTALGDIPQAMRLVRKAGTIAVLDMRYVTTFGTDGKQIGRMFEMESSSFTEPQAYYPSFTVDPSGNVYFMAWKQDPKGSETPVLAFSRYSPSTQVAQKKNTLTISHGYWYERFPDSIISLFRKANPDWTVEYGRLIEQTDLASVDQIVLSITTELMAGRGADIIALANLPYRAYIDRGLLVNLDQMVASDKAFPSASLRQNVLDALRYKGGLYVLPPGFKQNVIYASKKPLDDSKVTINDTEWTWLDFFAVGDKVRKDTNGDGVVDRFALPSFDASSLFHTYILPSVLDTFLSSEKRQASFTDPRFIELLKTTKSFAERNSEKNPFSPEKWTAGAQNGSIVFRLGTLQGPFDPQTTRLLFKGDAEIYSQPGSGKNGDQATCAFLAGINKNSRNTQKAWEFLKLMVSEELQQHTGAYGFPLSTVAHAKLDQNQKEFSEMGMAGGGFDSESMFTFAPLTDIDIALVQNLVTRIKRSQYTDSRLSSILTAELEDFFAGTRSAEDSCKSLQQKVMTYLQE